MDVVCLHERARLIIAAPTTATLTSRPRLTSIFTLRNASITAFSIGLSYDKYNTALRAPRRTSPRVLAFILAAPD